LGTIVDRYLRPCANLNAIQFILQFASKMSKNEEVPEQQVPSQSPIDLEVSEAVEADNHVSLCLGCSSASVKHSGNNFKVTWTGGEKSELKLHDVTYRPIQFHFHTPSKFLMDLFS